jgi:HAD superfamily hydrolase (TIGR01490 family)
MPGSASLTHLALFDLDHTLLDGDSNTLWLEFLAERGHLSPADTRRQADYLQRYVAERLDIVDYLGFHLGLLAGRPLHEWQTIRDEFLGDRIVPRIGAPARRAVATHRAAGHRLAIVTATHDFLSAAIGALLDVPVIAPRGEVRAGRLTGRVEGPICFREQKLACLDVWLEAAGIPPETVGQRHFYTDSANDLPLLEAVSHPVAVNADARLAAIARQRGWPLLTWHS